MKHVPFPVIDPIATGKNILALRKEKGFTVRDLQAFFGFEEPQAIYRWQYGKTLPSVDNLLALSTILEVPMEEILVQAFSENNKLTKATAAGAIPAAVIFYVSSRKKLASTRLISFSASALPMTRTTSAASSLRHRLASCASRSICR